MDLVFNKRIFPFWNQNHEFTWIESDVECFPMIGEDWYRHHQTIFGACRKFDVVLQAGGNCGLYPYLHSLVFKTVFTFEPDPVNFYCLAENCKKNSIIKFNTALNDKCEFVNMGIRSSENVGMHKIGVGDVRVYALTIDSLNLQELDLLHLDLEGHEYPALVGAKKTLKKCRPTVIGELTDQKEEVRKLLKSLDYVETGCFGPGDCDTIFQPKEILK